MTDMHRKTLTLLVATGMIWCWSVAGRAQTTDTVDLIECGDRNLEFKILCNPRWQTLRTELSLKMLVDQEGGQVSVTISKSEETGLTESDLTAPALQHVFGYDDGFKLARTRVGRRRAVRVEAHPRVQPELCLLDYFFIRDSRLYRVSYSAAGIEDFRRYLPLFAKMMRSFEFIQVKATRE